MFTVRKANDRGIVDHGWLKSAHTFSFASYYDPEHMGFRSLRVINDDVIAANNGFGKHPHRDMEIITYVLRGTITHGDSMGHREPIRAGDVQYMSAGQGVIHSEANESPDEEVHLLQIWIEPNERRTPPKYEQRNVPLAEKDGKFALIASGDKSDGGFQIRQDAKLLAAVLDTGKTVEYPLQKTRHAWIQVARGEATVNGVKLEAGDGAAVSGEEFLRFEGGAKQAEVLLFDLA